MANEDKRVNDCIFCKIIKGEIPTEKTYEDDNFIAFLDIKPKAEGHTIIISKNHFRNLLDMPSSLGNEMLEAVKKVSLDLIKQGKDIFLTWLPPCKTYFVNRTRDSLTKLTLPGKNLSGGAVPCSDDKVNIGLINGPRIREAGGTAYEPEQEGV